MFNRIYFAISDLISNYDHESIVEGLRPFLESLEGREAGGPLDEFQFASLFVTGLRNTT